MNNPAYNRAYYQRHRAERIESALNWRDHNRERYNAYMREYKRRKRSSAKFKPPAGAETLAQALGEADGVMVSASVAD